MDAELIKKIRKSEVSRNTTRGPKNASLKKKIPVSQKRKRRNRHIIENPAVKQVREVMKEHSIENKQQTISSKGVRIGAESNVKGVHVNSSKKRHEDNPHVRIASKDTADNRQNGVRGKNTPKKKKDKKPGLSKLLAQQELKDYLIKQLCSDDADTEMLPMDFAVKAGTKTVKDIGSYVSDKIKKMAIRIVKTVGKYAMKAILALIKIIIKLIVYLVTQILGLLVVVFGLAGAIIIVVVVAVAAIIYALVSIFSPSSEKVEQQNHVSTQIVSYIDNIKEECITFKKDTNEQSNGKDDPYRCYNFISYPDNYDDGNSSDVMLIYFTKAWHSNIPSTLSEEEFPIAIIDTDREENLLNNILDEMCYTEDNDTQVNVEYVETRVVEVLVPLPTCTPTPTPKIPRPAQNGNKPSPSPQLPRYEVTYEIEYYIENTDVDCIEKKVYFLTAEEWIEKYGLTKSEQELYEGFLNLIDTK